MKNVIMPEVDQSPTLVDLLRRRAGETHAHAAYTFLPDDEQAPEVALSYAELDRRAAAIAAALQRLSKPGDRVLLLYPPGLDYVTGFFGCLYAGVVAVPAYPPDPARLARGVQRLDAIIRDAGVSTVLTVSEVREAAQALFSSVPSLRALNWVSTDGPSPGDAGDYRRPDSLCPDSLAMLQYTSGSTGAPKGVMLSHRNLLANQKVIRDAFEHTPEASVVGWLPLYHDMGLIGNMIQPLYMGIHCALMSPLAFLKKPVRWLRAISRFGATTSGAPNFAYDVCVRKVRPEDLSSLDLSRWSVAFSGAEPVRADTMERFAEKFGPCGFRYEAFLPCYGLAEATLFVSGVPRSRAPTVRPVDPAALEEHRLAAPEGPKARSLVSCGRTFAEHHVAIVNPETRERCRPDEIGEIWVSGPSVAEGYWNKAEETEAVFRGTVATSGEGPFLRTGDLGFIQPDGEVFIAARRKDLIVVHGRNHHPHDLERTVEESHAAVRPGCVAAFSVEADDAEGAEKLVLVLEVSTGQPFDLQGVIASAVRRVAEEHGVQTHAVRLLQAGTIPKTSSGKIQRHACRLQFLRRELAVVADGDAPWGARPSSAA
jgi:acyl-CoA synthetase (AMP-forming)/AMP-acid ligase II